MNDQIKNINLKFACPADWDSMQKVNGAKHCEQCQKKVYDFTDAKQQEFLQILAENNNDICGRFRREQMSSQHSILPVWKKWASAALVLVGINIFNHKADAQSIKKTTTQKQKIAPDPDIVVGMYSPPGYQYHDLPQFPGKPDAFGHFLAKNIHYGKGMISGRVFASFTVNTDGTLCDYKILRGLNELNNNEVIRVLKLSPKWKPAIRNGKPAKVAFTIPVNFE